MLAVQQQTAAAASEMRESNQDQRAFMRANDEQMTQLTTLIGQHYGLSRQNLEQAVAQIMGMQRENTEGMANLIFGAAVRMSDALQLQATERAHGAPCERCGS